MRIAIPITGTVKRKNPVSGDLNDPIRPVEIDLGNVSRKLVFLDLISEVMVLEITPAQEIEENGEMRPTTMQEKTQFIEYAKDFSLERKTIDELYSISKSPRLKNPFKEVIE